jgi:RNA polymerase primary sigma factor
LYKAKKEAKNGIVQLNKKLSTLPSVTNLSKPINEDGDTLIDVLVNEAADAPDSQFNNQDTMKQELIDTMSVLDDREMTIVRDYFGLVGTPKTLAEIGEEFNLTKERVRQIKEKALRKLRNDSEGLLDYMSR